MRLRIRRRWAAALASVAAAGVLAVGFGTTPAQASGQICAQSGTGYCLNNWNGANGAVKMGQNGWPHQLFGTAALSSMCGGGHVTGTCPFSNLALDSALFNEPIVTIKDASSGLCVGLASSTSTGAIETTCPNTSGTGGGWGVVYVEDFGCNVHLDNVRATDTGGTSTPWNLRSGGATGAQAIMSTARDGTACWGTG
jgi:hypothetical protein